MERRTQEVRRRTNKWSEEGRRTGLDGWTNGNLRPAKVPDMKGSGY